MIKVAIAHLGDSRSDFFARREALVNEELGTLGWLRENFEVEESGVMVSCREVARFAKKMAVSGAQSLIIHLPIWADPIFTVKLFNYTSLPILLMGNDRPDTSSLVGLLGAGGALDQVGCPHTRIFEHESEESQRRVKAFVRAAAARATLRGQTLGLFGGRSLGIFTATVDPAQWQRLFGVDIETIDQLEIVKAAEEFNPQEVERHTRWLLEQVAGVEYNGKFTSLALEKQVRSYMATRALVEKHGLDFVGVKCQPELSDGYVTQCAAHMLMNGLLDADGPRQPVVHACESDADGALTMQVLHLLSEGRPVALMDLRWFNRQNNTFTLANCGAVAVAFYATPEDPHGFSKVHITPHAFGKGGGGAFPAMVAPQRVTLARLCRKAGEYWMAIVSGEVESRDPEELKKTTSAFPQAFVRTPAGVDFLETFGSNHIHMIAGDYVEELTAFCRLTGIRWQTWNF
jgi:L-fucose/D-arabinose isomerase